MQITLARHGRPQVQLPTRLAGPEVRGWYARYSAAALDPTLPPPASLLALAGAAGQIFCSDLKRSIQSAQTVAPTTCAQNDPLFREPEPPTPPAWSLALGPRTAGVLFWVLWLAGRSADGEPLSTVRARARQGARRLVQAAAAHGQVLLIGHGLINVLIAHELRRQGWKGPRIPSRRYWDWATYHRPSP